MKIIECPRDAMQGLAEFIPTSHKIKYINALLEVGFDTIDFGSFVSPKAIPQMKDTTEVLKGLTWEQSSSKLLAIVANTRGALEASKYEAITYLGFPLSMSETFQQKNTNKTILQSLNQLEEIQNICFKSNKKLVTYISMAFGNPYGDSYESSLVTQFVDILITLGSAVISLADTVGLANATQIQSVFFPLANQYPTLELGIHLHSNSTHAIEKIDAAFKAGCKRFDSAIRGFGGCPMANDELVGNLATETLLGYLETQRVTSQLNKEAFSRAMSIADEIFPKR